MKALPAQLRLVQPGRLFVRKRCCLCLFGFMLFVLLVCPPCSCSPFVILVSRNMLAAIVVVAIIVILLRVLGFFHARFNLIDRQSLTSFFRCRRGRSSIDCADQEGVRFLSVLGYRPLHEHQEQIQRSGSVCARSCFVLATP